MDSVGPVAVKPSYSLVDVVLASLLGDVSFVLDYERKG